MENKAKKPILTIDQMTMRFGGLEAVSDFSAHIQPGATIIINSLCINYNTTARKVNRQN